MRSQSIVIRLEVFMAMI